MFDKGTIKPVCIKNQAKTSVDESNLRALRIGDVFSYKKIEALNLEEEIY